MIANGMFLGMIGREQLDAVANGYRETRTVGETIVPAADLDSIAPTTPVSRLISRLVEVAINPQAALPVVQDGRLLGVIRVEEMLSILDLEDEFGLFPYGTPEKLSQAEAAASV